MELQIREAYILHYKSPAFFFFVALVPVGVLTFGLELAQST